MKSWLSTIPKVPSMLDPKATPMPIEYITSMFRLRLPSARTPARNIG